MTVEQISGLKFIKLATTFFGNKSLHHHPADDLQFLNPLFANQYRPDNGNGRVPIRARIVQIAEVHKFLDWLLTTYRRSALSSSCPVFGTKRVGRRQLAEYTRSTSIVLRDSNSFENDPHR